MSLLGLSLVLWLMFTVLVVVGAVALVLLVMVVDRAPTGLVVLVALGSGAALACVVVWFWVVSALIVK